MLSGAMAQLAAAPLAAAVAPQTAQDEHHLQESPQAPAGYDPQAQLESIVPAATDLTAAAPETPTAAETNHAPAPGSSSAADEVQAQGADRAPTSAASPSTSDSQSTSTGSPQPGR